MVLLRRKTSMRDVLKGHLVNSIDRGLSLVCQDTGQQWIWGEIIKGLHYPVFIP